MSAGVLCMLSVSYTNLTECYAVVQLKMHCSAALLRSITYLQASVVRLIGSQRQHRYVDMQQQCPVCTGALNLTHMNFTHA